MGRCEFRHDSFKEKNSYRGDGTDQCWVTEIGDFGIESKRYCILHGPEDKKPPDRPDWPIEGRGAMQAEALRKLLDEWNDENEKREQEPLSFFLPGLMCGDINLSRYRFSGSVVFDDAAFSGDVDFDEATFWGNTSFRDVTFSEGANLGEGAGFSVAKFIGDVSFNGAKFSRYANFEGATFERGVVFDQSTFANVAMFQNAKFSDNARFLRATFSSYIEFSEAAFGGEANFNHATFRNLALFYRNRFEGSAIFYQTMFGGGAQFDGVIVFGRMELKGMRLEKSVSLVGCRITSLGYETHMGEQLIFNQCDGACARWDFSNKDCTRVSFLNMPMTQIDFLGADIRNTRFEAWTWDDRKESGYARVYGHKEYAESEKIPLLQSLYSQLNKNMEANRDYGLAGDFHYREMEIRQRLLAGKGLNAERMVLRLYGLVADFGENWVKLFFVLAGSFLLTAFVVACIEVTNLHGMLRLDWIAMRYPLYLKTVILGIIPSGFQRNILVETCLTTPSMFLMAFQVIVSLTLTTLFVMAIRRRFKR